MAVAEMPVMEPLVAILITPPGAGDAAPRPTSPADADDPFLALLAGLLQPAAPAPIAMPAVPMQAESANPALNLQLAPAAVSQVSTGATPPSEPATPLAQAPAPVAQNSTLTPTTEALLPATQIEVEAAPLPTKAPQPRSGAGPSVSADGSRRPARSDSTACDDARPNAAATGAALAVPEVVAVAARSEPTAPEFETAGPEGPERIDAMPVQAAPLQPAQQAQPPGFSPVDTAEHATPRVTLALPDHHGRVVSARLVLSEAGDSSSLRIDLEPADLGRVEVSLRLDDDGVASATFTVDRPETLQLLQRDARTVGDLLGSAGFTVPQGGLGFTLRDQPGGAPWSERVGRAAADGTRTRGEPTAGAATRRGRRGLLDLQV